MKAISLNLDDLIFKQTEIIVAQLNKPRNRYLNEAIDYYNKLQEKKLLKYKLEIESAELSEESMNVLRDFEEIDYGDPAE